MSISTQITVAATAETIIITAPVALRGPMGDVTPAALILVERAETAAAQSQSSAGQAASSAAQAGESASQAGNSASSAAQSAAAASDSESAAGSSASSAQSSASSATDSASSASSSAGAAQTSAGEAQASVAAADQSATDAAQSATSAQEDADATAARVARFLAPSAVEPTQRDNGQPLQVGDQWPKITDGKVYSWTGLAWVALDSGAQQLEAELADPSQGAEKVAVYNQLAPAFLKTTSDILNGIEVSISVFMDEPVWRAVRSFSGMKDAQPGIQLAIDVMNSNAWGGSFFMPDGLYPAGDTLSIKSNVSMRGSRRTFVRGEFASPKNRIFTSPHTVLQENVTMQGFIIDRRGFNAQHGALFGGIRNFDFKDMSITGPTNPTIACGAVGFSAFDTFAQIPSENVNVTNLYLEASNNFGVAFGNVRGGTISGISSRNCFREVIGLEAWGDGTVSAGNPLGTLGIVEDIVVSDSSLNCTQDPAYHFGGSVGPVMLIGGATSGGATRNCQISGMTISVKDIIPSSGFDAVALTGSPIQPLENINVTDMIIRGAPRHGVSIGAVGQVTRNCSLSDIKVYDANSGVTSSGSAIRVSNATGIDTDNIRVRGTRHLYAIEEASGANGNTYTDLLADPGASGNVKLVGATSKYSLKGVNQGRGGEVIVESAGVEDDGIYTFSARGLNGRASYRIRGNFGLNDYASFSVNGNTISAISIGTDVRIGVTNPDVDTALNVYLTGSLVTIKNRLGSARSFVLESVAP